MVFRLFTISKKTQFNFRQGYLIFLFAEHFISLRIFKHILFHKIYLIIAFVGLGLS